MYIAQTIDSKYSFIAARDETDNTVTISVFEGVFPSTLVSRSEPVSTFKFNEREATDLLFGIKEARDDVQDAAKAQV